MGAHSSAESLMAGVESDSIRVKATALAVIMQDWLTAEDCWSLPRSDALDGARSDLVEWCRSARDVLEAVGRG
jgi:hypothetical protein